MKVRFGPNLTPCIWILKNGEKYLIVPAVAMETRKIFASSYLRCRLYFEIKEDYGTLYGIK